MIRSKVRFSMIRAFFAVVLVAIALQMPAQMSLQFPIELRWNGVVATRFANDTLLYIGLESGDIEDGLPVYATSFPIYDDAVKVKAQLDDIKSVPLAKDEQDLASCREVSTDYELVAFAVRNRNQAYLSVRVNPVRKQGGRYEKLLSATISVTLTPDLERAMSRPNYSTRSALASGDWYKIGLPETGIYKLTYSDLTNLGINLAGLDPRTIRVYHNGGGVLPEKNSVSRHDDLVEIPIYVHGEADGTFDQSDYILFYGRGPVCWEYNEQRIAYEHVQNPYDDYSYAFVVTGKGQGKRIQEAAEPSGNAYGAVTQFIDYQVHESDDYNIARIGRTYYGDRMESNDTKTFDFSFPYPVTSRQMQIYASLAGVNRKPAIFEVFVDDVKQATYPISTSAPNNHVYGNHVGGWIVAQPTSATVSMKLKHNKLTNTSAQGYVDYLSLNVWRELRFVGPQMPFRNPEATGAGRVFEYKVSDASQQMQVWNVTDAVAPSIVKGQLSGSMFSFKINGVERSEFVAFDGSNYLSAQTLGKVENQDLHGIRDVDFLIVTHPDFKAQADRLKALHNRIDPDLNVFVVTTEMIYNEFGCGAKDVSAIRDFCRMLYLDSSPGREIKYLLLFGDCSFDYKNRFGTVDFVPSFETVASLVMEYAFVTDDFYGFMDANEGNINGSIADIGIGRFPVTTDEQATQMVDKVERYVVKDATTMQPWRNVVTFLNDDETEFLRHTEDMAAMLKTVGGDGVVVDKIYLGAYPQVSSPGGEICPEMNAAINSRMEKGTLVLNYTGHGGEVQLATEKILQKKDVDSWRNAPMYPLMITGTCEFSRYDDHERTSLGEYAFLNPYGGMIAMFTTSRITFGNNNYAFNTGVYNNLFRINGGELYRLGDVYRMAKTEGKNYEKRYVFFGDPALRIAYPEGKVETTAINGRFPGYDLDSIQINDTTWETYKILWDTISALQPVEIEGVVKDCHGNEETGFNGVVYVTVYDKEADLIDMCEVSGGTIQRPFKLRNSMIFNGKTEARNGRFKISFIVPRDIAYRFGTGMISYYATDHERQANGVCEDFIIGGFYNDAVEDGQGPDIRLFIDDTLFVSGGLTGESPILLAFVEDESGINTTGAGIGHDIMATLAGPSANSYNLNDCFVAETDNPGKGQISYKMQGLADGDYTLTLKVWDIYNNSSTSTINFTVVNSAGMSIENPVNVPNPFTEETRFTFDHNQVGNNVKVQILIYDIMGRWVNTLTETVSGTSARIAPIRSDGRNPNGEILGSGIYIYRIIATNDQGEIATATSKLVLCR